MKAFSRPRQQRRYDMIIDINKVKVAWSGRCRLVENFTNCRAGGGDCGAPGQDKTTEADDDERDLHRVRTVADLRKTFYFFDGQIKRLLVGRVRLTAMERFNAARKRAPVPHCQRLDVPSSRKGCNIPGRIFLNFGLAARLGPPAARQKLLHPLGGNYSPYPHHRHPGPTAATVYLAMAAECLRELP